MKKNSGIIDTRQFNDFSIIRFLTYISFLFLFSFLILSLLIISFRLDGLDIHLEKSYERANRLAFQIENSLKLIESEERVLCSNSDLKKLKTIKETYFFLEDLGRINKRKIACTIKNGKTSSLTELSTPDYESEDGFQYRNSQTNLFFDAEYTPTIRYRSTIATVSSTYLYMSKYGQSDIDAIGGITYTKTSTDNHFIYGYFGKVLPNDIESTITHENSLKKLLLFPDAIITKKKCSNEYNLCVTVIDNKPGFYGLTLKYKIISLFITFLFSLITGILFENYRSGPNAFIRKLKKEIKKDNIYPVYQPQLKMSNKKITGVESLARWDDPETGMISPEVFITIAENSGLIEELTKKLVIHIFDDLHVLLESDKEFTVSINVSSELLTSDTFIEFLNKITSTYKFSRNQIILEITERTELEKEEMSLFSKKIKENEYLVSIDDFGTGLSNLSWLSTIEPDEIKIDKMFTHAIGIESVNCITLEGIFSMLDHLPVKVVFEGIETQQQSDYIYKRVPDSIGQGWLFEKPIKIEELRAFLRINNAMKK